MASEDDFTWAELWGVLELDSNAMLSVTQTRLAAEAYEIEQTPEDAVENNTLTEVHKSATRVDGDASKIHKGYRLIGEPVYPEEVDA